MRLRQKEAAACKCCFSVTQRAAPAQVFFLIAARLVILRPPCYSRGDFNPKDGELMPSDDAIEVIGVVVKVLPATMYKVENWRTGTSAGSHFRQDA
jgi:hypothetical protein